MLTGLPGRPYSPSSPPNSFSCNTYGFPRKCCKQKTYGRTKSFSCNTYKKHGGGGLIVNQKSDEGFLSRATIGREGPLFTADARLQGCRHYTRANACDPEGPPLASSLHAGPHLRRYGTPRFGDPSAALVGPAVERGKDSDFKTLSERQRWRDQNGGVGRIRSAACDSDCPSARMV